MLQLKCIAQKGEESVVGYSGGENKHLTVVLSVTADGQMLSSKILRQCWIKYVSSVPKSFLEVNSNFSCKLLVLIPQLMINSAEERFHHLVERPEIVKRSVKVCGISSSDPNLLKCLAPFSFNSARKRQCVT